MVERLTGKLSAVLRYLSSMRNGHLGAGCGTFLPDFRLVRLVATQAGER
jgi:hypothetical protein